mgnify:CR=1 FL=1
MGKNSDKKSKKRQNNKSEHPAANLQPVQGKCPKCGSDVVTKHGRNKTVFYSCSKYPSCDFSSWDLPTNEKCPTCGGMLFRKKGKNQLICKTTGCKYKRDTVDTEDISEE